MFRPRFWFALPLFTLLAALATSCRSRCDDPCAVPRFDSTAMSQPVIPAPPVRVTRFVLSDGSPIAPPPIKTTATELPRTCEVPESWKAAMKDVEFAHFLRCRSNDGTAPVTVVRLYYTTDDAEPCRVVVPTADDYSGGATVIGEAAFKELNALLGSDVRNAVIFTSSADDEFTRYMILSAR